MTQAVKIGLIAGGAVAVVAVTILVLRYVGEARLPSLQNLTRSGAVSSVKNEYSPPSDFSTGEALPDVINANPAEPILAPPSLPDSLR